ncbi:solute carrier family 41 member 1-like [Bolinopsis microptera]|uniref:solute carrier family 41 member 1-like n=1 Tax=Bolinopsis microptera TaxID=2820187 RepID=UPI00307975F7
MCLIVLGSSHYQCNPDNISTPIAASLGDSITLGILSLVGSVLFHIPAILKGWVPILLAMLISSGVGIIMSKVAELYPSVVAFLPIINGIGGNLAAIQASRLSTSFHLLGRTDFSEYRTSLFLLLLTIPGHAVFLTVKGLVSVLLGMSYVLVMLSPLLRNLDPDLYSIPLLTALGDFLGTALLSLSVVLLDSAELFTPGN